MSCENRAGALSDILLKIAARGINMTKLESCPVPGRDFEYVFVAELEASVNEKNAAGLLTDLAHECDSFTFIGNYSEV